MYRHDEKQKRSIAYALLYYLFFKDLIYGYNDLLEIYKKDNDIEKFQTGINDFILEWGENSKHRIEEIKNWQPDFDFIKELHDKRMKGMYVDVENGILSTPNEIDSQKAWRAYEIFNKIFKEYNIIPVVTWEDSLNGIDLNKS